MSKNDREPFTPGAPLTTSPWSDAVRANEARIRTALCDLAAIAAYDLPTPDESTADEAAATEALADRLEEALEGWRRTKEMPCQAQP